MYFWRGNWIHSRFFQKLTVFSSRAMEREGKGRQGGTWSLRMAAFLPLLGVRAPSGSYGLGPYALHDGGDDRARSLGAFHQRVLYLQSRPVHRTLRGDPRLVPCPAPTAPLPFSNRPAWRRKPPVLASITKDPRAARDLEKAGWPERDIPGRCTPCPPGGIHSSSPPSSLRPGICLSCRAQRQRTSERLSH